VIYVDTSLLLPVYVLEAQSEQANNVLESSSPIIVSDLTVAEFYVGLARKVKLGELTTPQSEAARAAFESHLAEGLLQRHALRPSHSEAAGDLAWKSPVMLRTLDALHLAVAVGLGAPLATFDGRLADAARAFDWQVVP
jgi:predicted nucleic acid-binding protein